MTYEGRNYEVVNNRIIILTLILKGLNACKVFYTYKENMKDAKQLYKDYDIM